MYGFGYPGTRGFSRVWREFTPIRLKVFDCDHVGRHVKKCPKTHIILRKTKNFKSKFSINDVASV